MGMYCCCGVKIISCTYECKCEWEGWNTFDEDGKLAPPDKDGFYEVRVCDNGGDRDELVWHYSVEVLERTPTYFADGPIFEKHWEGEMWDDYHVYAWKPIK